MWVLDSDLFEGALNPPRKLLRTRTKAAIDENRPVALVAAGKDLSLWSHARRRYVLQPSRLPWGRWRTNPDLQFVAGQLAISDKTISRKHITITVDNVPEGGGVR